MSVEVRTSRTGMPFLLHGDEVIPVSFQSVGDLVMLELTEPGTLARLRWAMKEAIEEIAGLDATLPDIEWQSSWEGLLTINEFAPALGALMQAGFNVQQTLESGDVG